jgi:hypothetical protein
MKVSSSADPYDMSRGISPRRLQQLHERVEELRAQGRVSHSFGVHSSVHQLQGRPFDTTDRSAVSVAEKYGFDREGQKNGMALQREAFYTNPFLTCRWCNLVTFVDVRTVRWMVAASVDLSGLKGHGGSRAGSAVAKDGKIVKARGAESIDLLRHLEGLPACRRCSRADMFVIGPQDFREEIEARERLVILFQ